MTWVPIELRTVQFSALPEPHPGDMVFGFTRDVNRIERLLLRPWVGTCYQTFDAGLSFPPPYSTRQYDVQNMTTMADEFDERSDHVSVWLATTPVATARLTPGPRSVFEQWSQGKHRRARRIAGAASVRANEAGAGP